MKDVHSKTSTYCVLDGQGRQVLTRTVRGSERTVLVLMAAVKWPFAICYEASCSYGWLCDRLSQMAHHVAVAHPAKLRALGASKRKNDPVDASGKHRLDPVGAHGSPCRFSEWG